MLGVLISMSSATPWSAGSEPTSFPHSTVSVEPCGGGPVVWPIANRCSSVSLVPHTLLAWVDDSEANCLRTRDTVCSDRRTDWEEWWSTGFRPLGPESNSRATSPSLGTGLLHTLDYPSNTRSFCRRTPIRFPASSPTCPALLDMALSKRIPPPDEPRTSFGCTGLDQLSGGGLGAGEVLELSGALCTGKSFLCHALVASSLLRHDPPGYCVYMDTRQQFRPDLLVSMAQTSASSAQNLLERVRVYSCPSLVSLVAGLSEVRARGLLQKPAGALVLCVVDALNHCLPYASNPTSSHLGWPKARAAAVRAVFRLGANIAAISGSPSVVVASYAGCPSLWDPSRPEGQPIAPQLWDALSRQPHLTAVLGACLSPLFRLRSRPTWLCFPHLQLPPAPNVPPAADQNRYLQHSAGPLWPGLSTRFKLRPIPFPMGRMLQPFGATFGFVWAEQPRPQSVGLGSSAHPTLAPKPRGSVIFNWPYGLCIT